MAATDALAFCKHDANRNAYSVDNKINKTNKRNVLIWKGKKRLTITPQAFSL